MVMGLVAWGIYGLSGEGSEVSIAYLFLSVAVAVPTYVGCLWLLGEVREAEKSAVLELWDGVVGK